MSDNCIYPKNLVVYEIVYEPWENNTEGLPWKYIGSTCRDLEKYFGSIESKKWKSFWEYETKNNPEHFRKTVILNCLIDDGKKNTTLRELELEIQKELNVVKSSEYFNLAFACPNGFFGNGVSGKDHHSYGRKAPVEQIERLRKSNLGKKHSPEFIEKRVCSLRKQYIVMDKFGNKELITGIKRWCVEKGLRYNTMVECATGIRYFHGDYWQCRYADPNKFFDFLDPEELKLISHNRKTNQGKYSCLILTPDGNIEETDNITQYAREHGLHEMCLIQVFKNELIHHKNYQVRDKNNFFDFYPQYFLEHYNGRSIYAIKNLDTGEIIFNQNLKKYCKENNYDYKEFCKVVDGLSDKYMNMQCKKLNKQEFINIFKNNLQVFA